MRVTPSAEMSPSQGVGARFGPSKRILELAQHKTSKAVWATTPRDPIWPVSAAALQAAPSARIRQLARHRAERHVREAGCRGEEEEEEGWESSFRKGRHPSSAASQRQLIVRLSTPRTRSSEEARSPHSSRCEPNCPIWHVSPRTASAPVPPRVLQLSRPKQYHPDFRGNRQSSQSFVSTAAQTAAASQRVLRLALPRLKQSDVCRDLGRPEEPVWKVSDSAKRATASPRLRLLAAPKPLSKDYVPPRDPEWTRQNQP